MTSKSMEEVQIDKRTAKDCTATGSIHKILAAKIILRTAKIHLYKTMDVPQRAPYIRSWQLRLYYEQRRYTCTKQWIRNLGAGITQFVQAQRAR
ncbi:hypothetical protein QE152_g22703 [Popillia japonica]|uniref:Uncharacterized protein n=1 Tax=Popillia japonica TaxID=7064 RepID=A0AAW1KL28_POPJA